MKPPYFPHLEAEIAQAGITKKNIACALCITQKALSNKLTGKTKFTLSEAVYLYQLFPRFSFLELFKKSE